MKKGNVLKTIVSNPWEALGWTLLPGYAYKTLPQGYPPSGAMNLVRQEQAESDPPARALHDGLGMAGKSVTPMGRGLTTWWPLLKRTYTKWNEDQPQGLGAPLAYYTVFSLTPLLLIVIAIAGLVFGEEAAQGQILGQIQGLVGEDSAKAIQSMIEEARKPAAGILATVIATVMLLFGATGVFAQLQESLNIVWKVK